MFRKLFQKNHFAKKRLSDEKIYEIVVDEISSGIKLKGLWGKALANSEGDTARAESLYMKLRAQSIVDKINLDAEKASNKSEIKQVRQLDHSPLAEKKQTQHQFSNCNEHNKYKAIARTLPGYKEGTYYGKAMFEIRMLTKNELSYDHCIQQLKEKNTDHFDAALQGFTDHIEKLSRKKKINLIANEDGEILIQKVKI